MAAEAHRQAGVRQAKKGKACALFHPVQEPLGFQERIGRSELESMGLLT